MQTDNGSEFLGQADRPHYSLKNKVPLRLISGKINEVNSSSEESNMYWTHTLYLQFVIFGVALK